MLHYTIPASLDEDIRCFENDFAEFRAGKLHEIAFTAKRVKMGVYLERNYTTYMCRIRCTGNIITPKQLAIAGKLAFEYGDARVHVTTRAEIQIHHIQGEHVVLVLRMLKEAGLSCQGGGGNTIRNIVTNHDSGISPKEVFDVQPCILALTNRLIAEPDSWNLPRKIKIAFSSIEDDTAFCRVQDVGFVACVNAAGDRGFKVYAGGGLGAKPKSAVLLQKFIPEQNVYHAVRAIKNLYHSRGNRKNKHRNRIKFLLHDDLGEAAFRSCYEEELGKVFDQGCAELGIQPIDTVVDLDTISALEPLPEDPAGFSVWKKRNVTAQKQEELYEIRLPLLLGDLSPEDCFRLEEFLRPFGENTLRCGIDQNLYLRNIPENFLPNLYKVITACTTLSDKPVLYGNLLPCTGAQTCQVGINRPRPAAEAIFRAFDQADFPLPDDLSIRISGCPNSCANHWIGDLAFFGRVRRVQGRPIPTYNVLGNGGIHQSELRLGEQIGWVHSFDLPIFITEAMRLYAAFKGSEETAGKSVDFSAYWKNGGSEALSELCASKYNTIPSFSEDKNYYFDHGAEQIFSIKDLGRAECSAGIYDMIDVDDRAVKKHLHELESWEAGRVGQDKETLLREIVFRSARMLMVTRGEEPKTEHETYMLFRRHFLDTGIVNAAHRKIINLAEKGTDDLRQYADKIIALGREMTDLYKNMDSTMRFPGETENLAVSMGTKSTAEPHPLQKREKTDRFADLSGVQCPLNFVKTKVELAAMHSGETLEVILDDGDPIENVPGSVKLEGHSILHQEKINDQWMVVIKKA